MRTRLGSFAMLLTLAAACDYPRTDPAGGDGDAAPNDGGPHDATDASNGVGTIFADVETLDFGQLELATRRELDVTLRNTGAAPVTFSTPTVSGATAFSVASNLCLGALAPSTNCIIKVAAVPGATGAAAGQLAVPTEVGTLFVELTTTGAALVTVTATGPGRITSTPTGIDCGGGVGTACTARFTVGAVTLATDDATTVRWADGCLGNGACGLTLDAARAVTATTFAPLRRTFNDDDNGFDACHAIAAGPGDAMVIAGEVQRVAQGYNAWARAYDAAGAVQWSHEINTPSEGQDRGNDVVALADGTAVIAGKWYSGSNTRQNHFLAKISGTGTSTWFQESTIIDDDMYFGVARDSTGALITTGFHPGPDDNAQAWIRKLASGGAGEAWAVLRDGTASGDDAAVKVGTDSANNVIAVGYQANVTTGRDGWIAKYASNGAPIWSVPLAGAGASSDGAVDVAVASDDSLVVVGYLGDSSSIRAYTAAGVARWDVTAAGNISWQAVAVDANRSVVVTGSLGADLIVRKYTAAGAPVWQRQVPAASGHGVAVDSQGNVLVCGQETVAGNKTNVLVLKYYQ